MRQRDIYLTDYDMQRLRKLLEDSVSRRSRDQLSLQKLSEELDRAHLLSSKDIPEDVVTMNSRVRIKDLNSGEEMTLTLVFPAEANFDQGRVSIMAPIGTALIGCRAGDTVEWEVPSGTRKFKIEAVIYQPEAAGDYDL
jgi:regulator of nucleoside diphosphate kinase